MKLFMFLFVFLVDSLTKYSIWKNNYMGILPTLSSLQMPLFGDKF